jgi:putative membrane protein
VTIHLPTVNAGLNALSAVFLAAGYGFIRRKNVAAHKACMIAAFGASTLFLIGYLYHHAHAGITRFQGTGWWRPAYFSILSTHTVLAAAIVPLALTVLWKAYKADFARHRFWARVTWPLWMYVSLTGVVITWMLYYR